MNHTKLETFEQLPYSEVRINNIRNFINIVKKHITEDDELYLFGSYAKGLIKESSDFDILILRNLDNVSLKDIHKYKIELFSNVCDESNEDFDLKVYSKKQFIEALNKKSFFEIEVNKYMLNITYTR
ncbi:nucleotidyltransferase domain-containing protein [Romboutsia sp.]|uniref:nucleotidyltransferase domain-containing protein n=1 Tax=Romboutsia sp. TaxID=1965302 RepID=UPI003F306505